MAYTLRVEREFRAEDQVEDLMIEYRRHPDGTETVTCSYCGGSIYAGESFPDMYGVWPCGHWSSPPPTNP